VGSEEGQVAEPRSLGTEALAGLLSRLGRDPATATAEYERLHARLLAFFESHGSLAPGVDADDALEGLALKLREGHVIRDVPAYVQGLARNVLREASRRERREEGALDALRTLPKDPPAEPLLWDSFDRCLVQLEPARAELLVAYYSAARSSNRAWRAELAARRGLSLNELRIRVFRAREALRASLAKGDQG
jgi:DNA-directed RNA polymerase specialized sigma24 family protein